MLWSLIKILLFLALVVGLAFGVDSLLATSGGIQISVANTEFTLGPLQSIVALLILLLGLWLMLRIAGLLVAILRFFNGDETAISRYFSRNRERKGFQALADGLMALASGEGRLAMQKAARAERYLGRPDLTNLITAQAAEMAGDREKAEETYKSLLADERTRFVGVRGIMKQKLAAGDTEMAMKLAEKAFALKPAHSETSDVLLRLQAKAEDWSGARRTLRAKLRHGDLPRDVHRRRDAVLALSEARDVLDDDNTIDAREAAIEANRLSPDLVPAAVLAAEGYIAGGKARYAARVLKKAWEVTPHPDIAATFAAIAPDESAEDRIKRFAQLTKVHPDHPETRMMLAELHIAAEDFPAARKALGDLSSTAPNARALTIMAAIERGEGADDTIVRGWLTRAVTAPRGPQWVCDNCHGINARWSPVCENCQSFDTLSWTDAPEGEVDMPGSAGMLPLIVGAPATDAGKPGDNNGNPGDLTDDADKPDIAEMDAAAGGDTEDTAQAGDDDAETGEPRSQVIDVTPVVKDAI